MLEEIFYNYSMDCSTSIPDEVRFYALYYSAIIVYPSASAAAKVLNHLQGIVSFMGYSFPIDFYPMGNTNSGGGSGNSSTGAGGNSSGTISGSGGGTIGYEIASDWICDKCEFKNFARRI